MFPWIYVLCVCVYICIIALIGSSPLFFFFQPQSLSYGGFNGLKILYSFLYREYITHIHLLNFLLLLPPSAPFFIILLVFILGLYYTYERKHVAFDFLNLANFT
jgi:hypothetical protein